MDDNQESVEIRWSKCRRGGNNGKIQRKYELINNVGIMYLYGASGHAKVIIDILRANKINVEGIFDDNAVISQLWEYAVSVYSEELDIEGKELIISIGNNLIRKSIAERVKTIYGKALHPLANISERSFIGDGTVVMAGATINADVNIGEHCIINTGAVVEHDCVIDHYVHISPNATLCGGVVVKEGAHIGAGAIIIPGIKVGAWAIIGAGAVIIRDVAAKMVVVGNPGREVKK